MRLTNAQVPWQGRVEIFHDGRWGSVCDDSWGAANVGVICKQLGYGSAGVLWDDSHIIFGPVDFNIPIWLDDVYCDGSEGSIEECDHGPWGVTDCSHYQDVGVACGM